MKAVNRQPGFRQALVEQTQTLYGSLQNFPSNRAITRRAGDSSYRRVITRGAEALPDRRVITRRAGDSTRRVIQKQY